MEVEDNQHIHPAEHLGRLGEEDAGMYASPQVTVLALILLLMKEVAAAAPVDGYVLSYRAIGP